MPHTVHRGGDARVSPPKVIGRHRGCAAIREVPSVLSLVSLPWPGWPSLQNSHCHQPPIPADASLEATVLELAAGPVPTMTRQPEVRVLAAGSRQLAVASRTPPLLHAGNSHGVPSGVALQPALQQAAADAAA